MYKMLVNGLILFFAVRTILTVSGLEPVFAILIYSIL